MHHSPVAKAEISTSLYRHNPQSVRKTAKPSIRSRREETACYGCDLLTKAEREACDRATD